VHVKFEKNVLIYFLSMPYFILIGNHLKIVLIIDFIFAQSELTLAEEHFILIIFF